MAPTRRSTEGLLARVNFPLYTVQMLTSRHVLVAGGGGSANTGVANGFEIFELAHNGKRFVAEEVIRHETGRTVVMNCAAHSNGRRTYLVAGQESHCQLYIVNMKVVDASEKTIPPVENETNVSETRKRKKSEREGDYSNNQDQKEKIDSNSNCYRKLQFEIKPNDSVQTDFSEDEPVQRVVCVGRSGKLMATGGTDGHVRLWEFPTLKKKLDVKAHTKEVDDLHISPNEKWVASISKDGRLVIWSSETGKKVRELTWSVPEGVKYLYKRCRFALLEEDVHKSRLFSITNPVGRLGKHKAYLQLWDPHEGSLKKMAPCSESLSALAVSDNGKFVAVGTMFSGSVSIYIAFSLQRVLHVDQAHSMFVTGLEFLPQSLDGPPITSTSETAVVSISVDNKVCIHSVDYRSKYES
uniref:Prolactin regulatory element-binding protein n=1 Tax=Timema tahoe TaxID=61484 RepID=A0A7R9IHF6_9NEOP|nr:unnamed protein product [Timema tahoe]